MSDFHPDFQLVRALEVPSVRAFAREFLHTPSGARVLHLETDDPENCFALAFATPPDADHGVPHILEHAVLAGSEQFPVREPFFEMIKTSPAGFINAMTSQMWTIYPICTTLEPDFWNLAEVYADAVFRPLLSLETFEREGHHLKLEHAGDTGSNLVRSGIVYNEMKGAFSSPEALVYRSLRDLFPGGALGFESGGDPVAIPSLSWQKLREFHSRFYAPANCLLVLYGDIALDKQLAFWGEKLAPMGEATGASGEEMKASGGVMDSPADPTLSLGDPMAPFDESAGASGEPAASLGDPENALDDPALSVGEAAGALGDVAAPLGGSADSSGGVAAPLGGVEASTTPLSASLAGRPRFDAMTEPRSGEESYGVEPGTDLKEKTFLSLRFRCGDALDPLAVESWEVLQRLLAGHDGAPLKRALIASKLGADVFSINAEPHESEMVFHVALKGSERERAGEFEEFTLRTLKQIADAGFDLADIETALRQVAYETLEVASQYPLYLAMDMARHMATGGDALDATKRRDALERLGAKAREDKEYFPRLIRQHLLDNPARLRLSFYPDPDHGERLKELERAELSALKATFSGDELRRIDAHAQELEAAQGVPNSPDALATLPRLKRADLPDAPREIPSVVSQVAGMTLVRNDVFSNGVAYLQAAVDARDLPSHLWKFLPRYTDAFSKLGAAGQSWEEIAARRAASTGSLSAHAMAHLRADDGAPVVDVRFWLKTLDGDADRALDVLGDLLFELEPTDRARLHEMQTQGVAYYQNRLVSDALGSASRSAARAQSPIGWLTHLWDSPLTLSWMQHLTGDFDAHAGELMGGIQEVRDFLRSRARWTWSFTGSDAAFARVEARLREWSDRLGDAPIGESWLVRGRGEWDGARELPSMLGLAAPLDVQFCARAFPAPSHEVASLVDLGLALLRFDYLLPEIRFKGNAYGGGHNLDVSAGTLSYFSYRDPNLNGTLRVFDGARAWIDAQNWTDDDLERALLGNVRDAVPAIRPAQSTGTAMTRLRRGDTPELRAARYRQKLNASADEVKTALLSYLDEVAPRASTAVAASRVALEGANAARIEAGEVPFSIEEMLPVESV